MPEPQLAPAQIIGGAIGGPGLAGVSVYDAAGNQRVVLGQISSTPDYGLKVVSADGTTVIIDGTSDMFRIAATGSSTLAGVDGSGAAGGTASNVITLSTGLTFAPATMIFYSLTGSSAGQIPTPYYIWDSSNGFAGSGLVTDDFHGQAAVVNTNQTQVSLFWGTRLNRSGATSRIFRYYVLEQVGI